MSQLGLFATPFHRMFYINDLRISFPHAEHERVTVSTSSASISVPIVSSFSPIPAMNFVYSLFIPLGVLIAYNIVCSSTPARHEATYLPFLISITMACFVTDIIKNAVGRPRPDLLARCQPAKSAQPNTLVTIAVCTAPSTRSLEDGFRSFPSGHSSFAFAGLGFTALFLAGQLQVFNYAGGGRSLLRFFVCMVPVIGALLIAISRCEDYRHDVYDVCVGSLIGMTVAYWSYRRYWPKLSSAACSEPQPLSNSEAVGGWQRVSDEEQGNRDVEMDRGRSG